MAEPFSRKIKTVRVPINAFIAVQQMLDREGLADLVTDLSAQKQVDFGPMLSMAGRLGVNVSGVQGGSISFSEGLEAVGRLSDTKAVAGLSESQQASVKVSLTLIAELRDRVRAMPGLVARDSVAKAIAGCTTPDLFNCPDDWPVS
ncbi:hypothetical protein AB4Z10_13425 [Bosea sp. RAF48]|uniref:hypothetical protein n=1 Tax=Bosea sp. RAF48 TaxID=3237480 RepID=UPI003F917055